MNKKYIKKIKSSIIMFLVVIVVSIIACMFIGCGKKHEDTKESESLKVCYGEVIRYDVYAYNVYTHREIVINSESGNRMCFEIFSSECEDSILKSKVGDMVSITYTTENNIVKYEIIKD